MRRYRDLPAEMRLLLSCSRWPQTPAILGEIASLADASVDWGMFDRLQSRHRVRALTSNALLAAQASLPAEIRQRCMDDVSAGAIAELEAAAEAQRLLGALDDAGVRGRIIKGPAVSIAAYGRFGLRTNRDLDILVAAEDRDCAALVLMAADYRRIDPPESASAGAVARWTDFRKDFVLSRPGGAIVELHWRLFDNKHLLAGLECGASETVELGPLKLSTLRGATHLLYLCVHGAQHAWSRLKWLADLGAFIARRSDEQMRALITEAKRRRVYPAVGQALIMAMKYMRVSLPPDLSRTLLASSQIRLLVAVAERALLDGDGRELEEQRFGPTAKNCSHYLIASGWPYRLEEARFDLFDLEAAGLPGNFRHFGPFARILAPLLKRAKR